MERRRIIMSARIVLLAGFALVYLNYRASNEAVELLEGLENREVAAQILVRDIRADYFRAAEAMGMAASYGEEEEVFAEADQIMERLKARFDSAAAAGVMPADRAECLRDSLAEFFQRGRAYVVLMLEDPESQPAPQDSLPRRWCNPDELAPDSLLTKMAEDAEAEMAEDEVGQMEVEAEVTL